MKMMRKFLWLSAVVVVGVGLVAAPALGVSVHWLPRSPVSTDQGLTLNVSGTIAGLGNFDTSVKLTATGNPAARCTNPAGQSKVPGQNPQTVSLSGAQQIKASDINGNQQINVTTQAPTSPVFGDADFGCTNKSWSEPITDVAFLTATLAIAQNQVGGTALDGTGVFAGTPYETVVLGPTNCAYGNGTSDGTLSCPR
jgi:hypothetical protein